MAVPEEPVSKPPSVRMRPDSVAVEVFDAAGLHALSELFPHGGPHRYKLRDPAEVPSRAVALSRYSNRSAGDVQVTAAAERLGMALEIVEPGIEAFCFCDLRSGAMALTPPGAVEPAVGRLGHGLIHGGEGGMTALTANGTARTNLWVSRARMETALATLGEELRKPLRFDPAVDWAAPGPSAVRRLLLHAEAEFAREDGMATQPLALAAFTDLFVHTALRELLHNYREQLQRPAGIAIPAHLRRAEAFMLAQAEAPIGLQEIALAAGCSVRTLQNAFRLFRDTTPHRTLQAMRLERARDDLRRGSETVAMVARRYGFTNSGRFAASYARRFGDRPRRG